MAEVSNTATTCPEMFWNCPVFLTQLSQPQDTRDGHRLSQVLVRENSHIGYPGILGISGSMGLHV